MNLSLSYNQHCYEYMVLRQLLKKGYISLRRVGRWDLLSYDANHTRLRTKLFVRNGIHSINNCQFDYRYGEVGVPNSSNLIRSTASC